MKTSILALTLAVTATIGLDAAYAAAMPPPERAINHTVDQVKHEGFGVLRAVKAGKVEIAHGAIPSLHWPAMTMWFTLQPPLPKDIQPGDDVRFELEQTRPDEWAITRIERRH